MRAPPSARLLALGAATLAGTLAACSLLNGLDAEYTLQHGSSGGQAEGGNDGEPDLDGNAGQDAKIDNRVSGDGGVDGAGPKFCGDEHVVGIDDVTFCWDFEDSKTGAPTFGWDTYQLTNGTLTVDPSIGRNGSRGLHATISKPPVSGNAYLQAHINSGGPFSGVVRHELSFAFLIKGQKSTLYTASLGALGYGASLKSMGVSVYKGTVADGIDLSDPPGTLSGPQETVAPDEWRRARIRMERAGVGTTYATTVWVTAKDGTETKVDERTGFVGGTAVTEILVGAFFTSNDANGAVEVVIDDVLLTQTK